MNLLLMQVSGASESEKKEANELRVALEQQMDQLTVAHQKQVAALRDEIAEKQQLINDIKEYVPLCYFCNCLLIKFGTVNSISDSLESCTTVLI